MENSYVGLRIEKHRYYLKSALKHFDVDPFVVSINDNVLSSYINSYAFHWV